MTVRDVIVIGAGPSGSLLAYLLARKGFSVMLIDKSSFPRFKVCGCCLNEAALKELKDAGVSNHLDLSKANKLFSFRVGIKKEVKSLSIPDGVALSRTRLDYGLIQAAIDCGVEFLPERNVFVTSVDEEKRRVEAKNSDGGAEEFFARLVVVADGINGTALNKLPKFVSDIASDSLIGAGALLPFCPDGFSEGVVYMAVGDGGYLGAVVLENGELDLACAFDPAALKQKGSPGKLAQSIWSTSGLPAINELTSIEWKGTVPLTRFRKRVAGERLLVVGDAASYVEPFTGEGIALALKSARLASELMIETHLTGWQRWPALHRKLIARRQITQKIFSWLLKRPDCFSPVLLGLEKNPQVAFGLTRFISCG